MSNPFKIGDKVRCICDKYIVRHNSYPKSGEIYTVREINCVGLVLLEEIRNPVSPSSGRELGFSPTRFEKV